jgi:hypothetical protein
LGVLVSTNTKLTHVFGSKVLVLVLVWYKLTLPSPSKHGHSDLCDTAASFLRRVVSVRKTNMAAPSPRAHTSVFFIFFFSSFALLTIFLIYKLGAQLILQNKLCTQLNVYRKSYAHNLSLKKKIYAPETSSSCAYKLYA